MLKRKVDHNLSQAKHTKSDDNRSEEPELPTSSYVENEKSKYFQPENLETDDFDAADGIEVRMLESQLALSNELRNLCFKAPVAYIYNPLEYAHLCNVSYLKKYCTNRKKVLFLGMNPGPYGMCQTGVPFGEIKSVRDWLGIQATVQKPQIECPDRPILGFDCSQTEVSGDRFWKFFKNVCKTPECLFANAFVYNYCPLAFMKDNGGNLTPAELKVECYIPMYTYQWRAVII